MRISGATIIRNGLKLGFPFIEAIRSVLPLCDEMVVAVGDSQDDTRAVVAAIGDPRVRIIDTVWDMANRTGGTVLSEQTNIALRACTGDWICYIQSDEALHEADLPAVRAAAAAADADPRIDGLYCDYLHFYGSYGTVQRGRNWYAREVRLIKNGRGIVSHGDAQGFRRNGRKLLAAPAHARVFHYGWARPPAVMAEKIRSFHALWHDDAWIAANTDGRQVQDHFSDLGNLIEYKGGHPSVMAALAADRSGVQFIHALRDRYLARRTLRQALRDLSRRLPFGRHLNFKRYG